VWEPALAKIKILSGVSVTVVVLTLVEAQPKMFILVLILGDHVFQFRMKVVVYYFMQEPVLD